MKQKTIKKMEWPVDMRETVAQAFGHVRGAMDRAPQSTGRKHMLAYADGVKLGLKAAVLARCADCCGYYVDGRQDCECYACPLYPYMPYGIFRKRYVRKDRRAADNGNRN